MKIPFGTGRLCGQNPSVVIEYAPLEDELGDILDKAIRHAGLSEAVVSEKAGVPAEKIRDAIDYRYELTSEELNRLSTVLRLNDAGLQAIAQGRYPLTAIGGLPFCLYPLRMPYGIGVANAYIVADCSHTKGILFDTGPGVQDLLRVWPKNIKKLEAVFLTHAESEHTGGLEELLRALGNVPVFGPPGLTAPFTPIAAIEEGTSLRFGRFQISVMSTPGHSERHNCYVVSVPGLTHGAPLLVSGDVLFAGSIGGAHFCRERLRQNVTRLLETLPDNTVVAPGHGPLTTTANERRYNPFAV